MTEPITVEEFFIGLMQGIHNIKNPEHRCECKSLYEMAEKHFEIHMENNNETKST